MKPITDTNTAQAVGAWIANYYKNRNSYEVNFRQDFRLDANDMIYIQSEFEEMMGMPLKLRVSPMEL